MSFRFHMISRRATAVLALAIAVALGLGGPSLVLCQAPDGHFAARVLWLDLEAADPCCDFASCSLSAGGPPSAGALAETGSCQESCSDSVFSPPFRISNSRSWMVPALEADIVSLSFQPSSPQEIPSPRFESDLVPNQLAALRVTVLLI